MKDNHSGPGRRATGLPALLLAGMLLAGTPVTAIAAGAAGDKASATAAKRDQAEAEARLQRSRERLDGLSKALQAAVGDGAEYTRLRAMHDREVEEYDAATKALLSFPSPW